MIEYSLKTIKAMSYPGGLSIEKFKELKPEYKDINDERLWNAMEDYILENGVPITEEEFDKVEKPDPSLDSWRIDFLDFGKNAS